MLEQLFSSFGFRALWTPELIVILGITGFVYFWSIKRWQSHFAAEFAVQPRQKLYFILGLITLYFGWGSPLYVAGHFMVSFHMTQMVFSYMLAVPLILLGLPKWQYVWIRDFLKKIGLSSIGTIIMSPILALFLFNGLFSIYHLPDVFNFLMQSVVLHSIYQMILFIAASLMWWHMLAPLPSEKALPDLRRIGYIFANGVLITPACALIIFASSPLYAVYTDPGLWATVMAYCLPAGTDIPFGLFSGPNVLSPISATHDQQLAGIVMKIMQEVVYGATIGYVFKQWITKEKQSDGPSISDIPDNYEISPRPSE